MRIELSPNEVVLLQYAVAFLNANLDQEAEWVDADLTMEEMEARLKSLYVELDKGTNDAV